MKERRNGSLTLGGNYIFTTIRNLEYIFKKKKGSETKSTLNICITGGNFKADKA